MGFLLGLDAKSAVALLREAIADGDRFRALEEIVVPALESIGQSWEEGRVSLSQVYMAGRICERAVAEVLPDETDRMGSRLKMAIGVLEDHHALGKRMVKSALLSAGYQVLDYGHGRNALELVQMASRDGIDVLMISCLMLGSALRVRDVVDGLDRARASTVVVVGGAPFRLDPQLWEDVGAYAMGSNSADAVRIVQALAEDGPWE